MAGEANMGLFPTEVTSSYWLTEIDVVGSAQTSATVINFTWIRGNTAVDGVLDFDQLTRDPNNPTMLDPQHDSGDHLHPNDTGYAILAHNLFIGGPFQGDDGFFDRSYRSARPMPCRGLLQPSRRHALRLCRPF